MAARAAAQGFDPLLVAGGDGLLSEVVNGLAPDFARVALGLLPLGTGNDLARTLGIPKHPVAAVEVVRAGRVRRIDVATIATREGSDGASGPARYFLNATVAGFAGRVAGRPTAASKRRWRGLAYRWAALSELRHLAPSRTEVVVDGKTVRREAYAAVVANGCFLGGGMRMVPGARPDDGLLDVLVVPALPLPGLVHLLARLLLGGAPAGAGLVRLRGRRIGLRMAGEAWLNADGEALPGRTAEMEALAGRLRFLAPPGPPRRPEPGSGWVA